MKKVKQIVKQTHRQGLKNGGNLDIKRKVAAEGFEKG